VTSFNPQGQALASGEVVVLGPFQRRATGSEEERGQVYR
jgi:hypothetical protein